MSPPLLRQIVILIVPAVAMLVLAAVVWSRRSARGAKALVVMMLAVAEWSICYAMQIIGPGLSRRIFWDSASFSGGLLVPATWLVFILQSTGRDRWLTRRTLALLAVEPAITLVLVWTDGYHSLVRVNPRIEYDHLVPLLAYDLGPWFFVDLVYSYLITIGATLLLFQALVRSPHIYRGQRGTLLLAALVPWAANALYYSGLLRNYVLDPTPFAFAFTGVVLAWGLYRYRLMDIVPAARDAVIESMHDGVVVLDAQNRVVDLNPAAHRIFFGGSRPEVVGRPAAEAFRDRADLVERYRDVTEAQAEIRLGEGPAERVFELVISPLHGAHGRFTGRLIVLREITERKRAEVALQAANEQLRDGIGELERRNREMTLLSEMADTFQTCLNADEIYAAILHSARQLFPAQTGAVYVVNNSRTLAETVALWGERAHLQPVFALDQCRALRRGRSHQVDEPAAGLLCPHVAPTSPGPSLCVPMMAQGETLGVLHLLGGPRADGTPPEVRERQARSDQRLAATTAEHIALALANLRLRESLRNQAIRDPLTGLFNRRYMEETLDREISRCLRTERPLGTIMLDLDRFKEFNDTFGHEGGDVLLQALGEHLRLHIRTEDIACRYGGEEFVLILPDASPEVTLARAEKLRQEARLLRVQFRERILGGVTLSLGVASCPAHGTNGKALLRAADTALYRAKSEGRDRVAVAGMPGPAEGQNPPAR